LKQNGIDVSQIDASRLPEKPFPAGRRFRLFISRQAHEAIWKHARETLPADDVENREINEVGGMLVGKLVTKALVLQLFKRAGVKIAAKTVAKVVPIAGQLASAAIGFALFRKMGYQHVEACAQVARELQKATVIDAGTAQVPV